jgi:CRP-like cAMP-binding protein/Fe-S-cluster-containing hydrogenase component 2
MSSPDDPVQVTFDGQLITMPRSLADLVNQPPIEVTVDGRKVEVPRVSVSYDPKGKAVPRLTTIYDAAVKAGVQIPILCHREYMNPVAVCRVCSVQVKIGDRPEWRLAPACYRPVEPNMAVETHQTNKRVASSVKMLTELLMADHPSPCAKGEDCELETMAKQFGVRDIRMPEAPARRPHDDSSLVITVDHNACILCDRCIRGCNDIRDNQVIGRMAKGYEARIAFDLNTPMGDSTCVACGECMVSCPTGALINRSFVRPKPWDEETPKPTPISADQLAELPLFEGVSKPFLRWNEGAVVRRHFKQGDIICREGEFGSTAFYIEKGRVDIFIQTPFNHAKVQNNRKKGAKVDWGPLGIVRRFQTSLVTRSEDTREEESTQAFIHIDAPLPLEYEKPTAVLEQGEIFGEMTCMSFYPRSATVKAREDVTVLEMLRNVLYILQRSKRSRAELESRYRHRAIETHLRSVPIFSSLLEDQRAFMGVVNFLRDRVELIRLNPGDVIFRQGDAADSFYLVRIGYVKVSQKQPGGDHVLAYVGPGRYFGEIGLMAHIPEIRALAPTGVRVATCSALDHVDLVRIKGDDFLRILRKFPMVQEHLVQVARAHLEENERTRRRIEHVALGEFLNQGLMNAQSLLVLDLERCTRCDECTKACADAHDGVTRLIREGLRFDKYLVTTSCRSCLDPYCMVGCPVGSIRRRNSREIIIEDWCIGCGKCAENCPYGNINMHPFPTGEMAPDPDRPGRKIPVMQQKATTCDLCYELDGQPSCVYACPHDAAFRMTGRELLERVRHDMDPLEPSESAPAPSAKQGVLRPQS